MNFMLNRHQKDPTMFEATYKLNSTCTILAFIIHEDCLGKILDKFNELESQLSFHADDAILNVTLSTGDSI